MSEVNIIPVYPHNNYGERKSIGNIQLSNVHRITGKLYSAELARYGHSAPFSLFLQRKIERISF